jgi:hypothetical protein
MTGDSNHLMLSGRDVANLLKSTCAKGIPFKFTAPGLSMAPFICNGDSLTIDPILNGKTITEGDIVAFITPDEGRLIVHRMIKKKQGQYLIKGDNVYLTDGLYKQEHIYGSVTKIITSSNKGNFNNIVRKFILFLNTFKMTLAFLSRYKILTPICRITNKVLNEK